LDKEQKYSKSADALKEKTLLAEKLEKDLLLLKKQATQTNDEFMQLTDRYVALERELENTRKG
jgi:hypothetical protein